MFVVCVCLSNVIFFLKNNLHLHIQPTSANQSMDFGKGTLVFPTGALFKINPGIFCSGIDKSWPLIAFTSA